MKIILFICCLLTFGLTNYAQVGEGNSNQCSVDSFKTNKLNISTGIGINVVSDSVLMNSGYGYNSFYTTPNDNIDSLWSVAVLSSIYQPRPSTPFAYTGTYMKPGGHPSIMRIKGTVLDGYYDAFILGGACVTPSVATVMSSNWLSVYADAGGQNGSIINDVNDGYAYERCFYICNNDTLNFNLKLMADDIIDTVLVDKVNLYTSSSTSSPANYSCGKVVSINKTVVLPAGRHVLRVWTRDNAGGHLGLNVYGHIQSVGSKKNIIRSKFDSRCNFNPTSIKSYQEVEALPLVANPIDNYLQLLLSPHQMGGNLKVSDIVGKVLVNISSLENTKIPLGDLAPGIYYLRYYLNGKYMTAKMIKN